MEKLVFDSIAEQDLYHWWYVGRRKILASVIQRKIEFPIAARILEVGCGTGHNLQMLGAFGDVEASELDASARAISTDRLTRPVFATGLPELDDIPCGVFDLVALLDVLEHVDGETEALNSLRRRLSSTGRLLVTVPAHQWMWSSHDETAHHHRRYTRKSLSAALEKGGFKIELLQYFNSLLFPIAVADHFYGKLKGHDRDRNSAPISAVNSLFTRIFSIEAHLIGRLPMPPGLSLIAIASAAP